MLQAEKWLWGLTYFVLQTKEEEEKERVAAAMAAAMARRQQVLGSGPIRFPGMPSGGYADVAHGRWQYNCGMLPAVSLASAKFQAFGLLVPAWVWLPLC